MNFTSTLVLLPEFWSFSVPVRSVFTGCFSLPYTIFLGGEQNRGGGSVGGFLITLIWLIWKPGPDMLVLTGV